MQAPWQLQSGSARQSVDCDRCVRRAVNDAGSRDDIKPGQVRLEEARNRKPHRSGLAHLSPKDRAKLVALRSEVSMLYTNMGALRRQLATARSHVGGPDRSPSGSLQTWEQRVTQLVRREAKGWGIIRTKEAELREIDPGYRPPTKWAKEGP